MACSRHGGFWGGVMVIAALAAASGAEASTYRWQVDASGDWNVPGNWAVVEGPAGAGYPNLAGDIAVFDEPLTAARTVTIPDTATITIGRLTVELPAAPAALTITRAGTGLLVFDNLGEDAVVESSGTGDQVVLSTPIQLAADVTINGRFRTSRGIGESGGARNVTITGGSVTYVGGAVGQGVENTYTGTTTVTNGRLTAEGSGGPVRLLGALIVGDGVGAAGSADVMLIGNAIHHTAAVLVRVDGLIEAAIDNGFSASPVSVS